MRIVVLTDDRVGPVMAGSALRAWELARVLLAAGHDVVVAAASGSLHPEGHGPAVVEHPPWRWAEALISPPWCLPPRAFLGNHLLVVDGINPLLAELSAGWTSAVVRRRLRTAGARLPLVAARADAVLVAGDAQTAWWSEIFEARPDVPLLPVPFGIAETTPPSEVCSIEGVPENWSVILWWGGVWPWLDLETLLAARSRLGRARVSVVVPTAARPGDAGTSISAPDLTAAAASHGLKFPEVAPLERWIPYAERHHVLNRSSLVAVLHHPGEEADLSFRTRALDGVWACVPLLLSEGGVVAEIARREGWGGIVPPGKIELTAAAIDLLLGERAQKRCRGALADSRNDWRWSVVARPLVEALPALPVTVRRGLAPAAARAAARLAGWPRRVGR